MFVNSRWIKESRVLFLNLCHIMLYGLFFIDVIIFCITQHLWLAQWFWRSWNVKIEFTDRWVNNRWSEKLTASVSQNLNWHLPLKIYLLNAKYISIPIYGFQSALTLYQMDTNIWYTYTCTQNWRVYTKRQRCDTCTCFILRVYKRRPRRPPFLRVLSDGIGVTSSEKVKHMDNVGKVSNH